MAEKSQLNGAKIPISLQLDGRQIDGAVVKPLSFQSFADCIVAAQAMKQPQSFEARIRRLRLHRQVTYYTNGSAAPVSIEEVLRLSIPDVRTLIARLDDHEGVAGKIIRDGDGIDKAITYELGTPISMGQGKEPIRELEFHASTYGDIEDVLAADNPIQQTAELIVRIAKPLGSTLLVLPSTALNSVTVADGVMISREILPRFLGSPDE